METDIHGGVVFHGMAETKVTDSLQTQVPAEVRRKFKVAAGDVVVWEPAADGTVRVHFRHQRTLADLVGLAPDIAKGDSVKAKRQAQRGR